MNAVGVLMSLVFIAIGLGMLYYARRLSAKAQQSLSWPSAEGVISHSAMLLQMQQTSSSTNAATYKADVAIAIRCGAATTPPDGSRSSTFRPPRDGRRVLSIAMPTARRSPCTTTRSTLRMRY
jgi:Tfp pilus assembly protein PilV